MPVYTVHAPLAEGPDLRGTTDRFVFVRDGFSFWALVAGPVWLIYHRLWLALLGYIVVSAIVSVGLGYLNVSADTRFAVMILIALLMGFEAASLRRWTFSRRKWRQLDVVVADDEEAAERRFFDRWTASRRVSNDQLAVDRGGPPPTRDIPGQPFSQPPPMPHHGIIGLFPEPGVSR
jgi:Protein of unknown function (DUF2628)